MGQPYVNMFSSLELSDSPLCLFKAPSEVRGNLGQLEISSGAHLEQSHIRACVSLQDVTHKKRKIRHPFTLAHGQDKTHADCCSGNPQAHHCSPWGICPPSSLDCRAKPELGEHGQASLMLVTLLRAGSLILKWNLGFFTPGWEPWMGWCQFRNFLSCILPAWGEHTCI